MNYDDPDPEGCCFPGECCMPGFHHKSECYTAEMASDLEAEWRVPEAVTYLVSRGLELQMLPSQFVCCAAAYRTTRIMRHGAAVLAERGSVWPVTNALRETLALLRTRPEVATHRQEAQRLCRALPSVFRY